MAELPPSTKQALEKLEEQLTCGICLQPYADPKMLQCFHVFCEKCLQPLARRSPQGQAISCPNCRHLTPLPQNGVPDLQGAFLIHNLFDIQDTLQKVSAPAKTKCDKCKKREPSCYCRTCGFICGKCKDFHTEWEELSSHEIISLDQLTGDVTNLIPPVKKTLQCSKHPDKQLDIYCESCEELICRDCIVRVHRDHQYDLVRDAFTKHKDAIVASLQPVEQQLATVCKALEGLDARSNQISDQRQVIETQIQRSIQQLHAALEARKEDLITQLGQVTQQKLKSLAAQRDQLELVATRLKSCCDFVQETLRTGSEGEILAVKKPVTEQVKEMGAEFKPESLVPEEQADMKFIHSQTELTRACQQFGNIRAHSVCPAKCHTTGPGTKVAMVGEKVTATLHAMDKEGRECRDPVEVTFTKRKDVIVASLQPVEQQLATVCKALEGLDARSNQISDQRQVIETQIQRSIQQLHAALEARKEDLITQLGQVTQQKLKSLAAQRDQLELVATQLKSCRDFVQETLRTGSEGEILAVKKPVTEQVKEMGAEFKPESLVPEEQADMKFIHSQTELTRACQQFGMVWAHSVCPAKCHTTGPGTKVAMVRERATATLHAMDQEGRECRYPVEVTCEVVSSDGSSHVRGEVRRNGESKYEISYCPQRRGRHQLHIRVEGTHISGSPFTVAVLTTTPTSTIRGLNCPWGVAVNERGQIIVAERSGHCISIFSANGEKVRSFGSNGSAPGQLNYPQGVAITATGNILVCCLGNHCIQRFSPEGRSLKCIDTRSNGPLQFNGSTGIAIHPHSNKIFIADERNHRIQILNPDYTFYKSFGSIGTGNAELNCPSDISFDSTGNVFVCDHGNNRVQVFTEDGVYVRQFGEVESGDGELYRPAAIAIDSNDIVYICECDNHQISLFTRDGHFLKSFGTQGTEPGQFNTKYRLAIDKDGTIFVSDYSNSRVHLF